MRNIPNKVDDSGDVLPAGDFNAWKNEAQGVVTSAGLTLDPADGPDTDTEMVKKALAIITSTGCSYNDTGSANTYVLAHPNSTKHVPAYKDGMVILFKADNANTGASTVNIASLGVKNITLADGSALISGDIVTDEYVFAIFNNSSDRFELIKSRSSSFSVTRNNVAQTISSGVFTKIEWTTEDFDTNSDFDNTVNYRFTPSAAGKYLLIANIGWKTVLPVGQRFELSIYKNGAIFKALRIEVVTGINDYQSTNIQLIADANGSSDYFEIFIWQDSGSSEDIDGSVQRTFFTGSRVV